MLDILIRIVADGLLLPVVLLGAWGLLFQLPVQGKYGRYRAYCRILMAGLTAYLLAKLIGSIYQPEVIRPFQQLGVDAGALYLNNPGFPSDHMLFATAITLAVWFETRKKWLAGTLVILTLLIGLGRILALVHTPLDVAGGALIACIGALWYLQSDKPKQTIATHAKS